MFFMYTKLQDTPAHESYHFVLKDKPTTHPIKVHILQETEATKLQVPPLVCSENQQVVVLLRGGPCQKAVLQLIKLEINTHHLKVLKSTRKIHVQVPAMPSVKQLQPPK